MPITELEYKKAIARMNKELDKELEEAIRVTLKAMDEGEHVAGRNEERPNQEEEHE